MKIYWFKKKEIILIFMFSIDLMLAGEPIRATRACDPSKVRLIRTRKCCVKNRLLLIITGSYRWLQVVGAKRRCSFALPKGRFSAECTAAPTLLPFSWRNSIALLLLAKTLIPAVRCPTSPLCDDGVRFRGVTDLSRTNSSCRTQYARREPQTRFDSFFFLWRRLAA